MTELQVAERLILPDPVPDDGPLVSVLIASYNYEKFVGKAVRSVLDQTYRNFELIIVDDASTDGAIEIIEELIYDEPRATLIQNKENVGGIANFEKCMSLANGKYIKFLQADDRFYPTLISKMVAVMESDDSIVIATSKRDFIDQDDVILPDEFPPISLLDVIVEGTHLGNTILKHHLNFVGEPTTAMFRKHCVDDPENILRIGGVAPVGVADILMWLRIMAQGKVAYFTETLSQFRLHPDQRGRQMIGTTDFILSWIQVIDEVKKLSFLSDPSDERAALATYLVSVYQRFVDFAPRSDPGVIELHSKVLEVVERIMDLSEFILAGENSG